MNPKIAEMLKSEQIELPIMGSPKYQYVTSTHSGLTHYFSGKTAQANGVIETQGILGSDLSVAQGIESARICAINLLAQIENDLGLENVNRILKVTGFVASSNNFFDQPTVINAASELFVKILGESGKHARSAIGVAALPGNSPVEIELILESKKIG
jgi:enamine deaminase RidA (YjgF/YER057c/UK114 family)